MSTILFVTIDAGGNLPPALAIARKLHSRGHRILFLGHPQQRQRVTNAGFEFSAFSETRAWDRENRASAARTVSDFAHAAASKQMARDFLAVARAEGVDLTVVDCMLPAVSRAARTLSAPSAVLFHTFYAFWTGPWAHGPVGRLAQLRGVNARKIWRGADLELVLSDPLLDPGSASVDARRIWTGAAETAAVPARAEAGRPRILVSLSTVWLPGQVDAYRRIVSALAELPVDAIVTTGGMATPEQLAPPPNVTVVGFTDHAALLPTIDLVVDHGGHSTTMKAVISGLPVLVIPMHPMIDQPMIGKAIQKAGLGLTLKKSAEPDAIRKAIAAMLADQSFRDRANEAAERHADAGGPTVAADALSRLLASHEHSPVDPVQFKHVSPPS